MSLDPGAAQPKRAIYLAALDIAEPRERQVFLEQACAGDAERLLAVERLLAAHDARVTSPVDRAIEQLSPPASRDQSRPSVSGKRRA